MAKYEIMLQYEGGTAVFEVQESSVEVMAPKIALSVPGAEYPEGVRIKCKKDGVSCMWSEEKAGVTAFSAKDASSKIISFVAKNANDDTWS